MSIEKAAEAIVDKSHEHCATWITIEEARELARAALPHLMEEPTAMESERAYFDFRKYPGSSEISIKFALTEFVCRRNAPPEPPKEIAVKVPGPGTYSIEADGKATAYILAETVPSRTGGGYAQVWRPPPEPDPRREALVRALAEDSPLLETHGATADRLLSALDSLKEPK